MGEIHVHEFISLDGVIEDPRWTMDFGFDPQMGDDIGKICDPDGAILLGRVTYEMFEPAWSTRTAEDDPGAPFFNETRKYVVSSTLEDATWQNSEIVEGYDPEAIRRLKDSVDGTIYMSGSATLVRALLADGLIDGLHLFVFPVTLGEGRRLFEGGEPNTKYALEQQQTYPNGVQYLNYRPQA